MLTIRNNIFETNSSSTHGVCLKVLNKEFDYRVKFIKDKVLKIDGFDFSQYDNCIYSTIEKISLCAMIIMSKYDQDKVLEFENWIKEKTGAKEVINNIQFMKNAFFTTDLLGKISVEGLDILYKIDTIDKEKYLSEDFREEEGFRYSNYLCEFSIIDIINDKQFLEAFIFTPMNISFGEIEE